MQLQDCYLYKYSLIALECVQLSILIAMKADITSGLGRAHWITSPIISLCDPTIKRFAYHVIQLIYCNYHSIILHGYDLQAQSMKTLDFAQVLPPAAQLIQI